ncbi:hypothetical protein MRS44_007559 [Fusarium solani]|uniref:uncharacterized protein n=1 Tax=Fusarium solani TaxID=169388 RepID=UPI0032C41C93|nr:hypothetical protein MRS44_007559 [Fusarium solani]
MTVSFAGWAIKLLRSLETSCPSRRHGRPIIFTNAVAALANLINNPHKRTPWTSWPGTQVFGTPVFDGLLGVNGAACLTVMRAELGEKRVEAARQDNKHGSEVCDMILRLFQPSLSLGRTAQGNPSGDLGDLAQGGLQEACYRGFLKGPQVCWARTTGTDCKTTFRAGPDAPLCANRGDESKDLLSHSIHRQAPSDDYIQYTVTVRDETPSPPLTVETAKPRMQLPLAPQPT